MRVQDADILIIPGLNGSGPGHWQSRWEAKLSSARRIMQRDWERPALGAWRQRIIEEVDNAARPVVFVSHSLGVLATVHATALLQGGKVKGAFLAAPPSAAGLSGIDAVDRTFLDVPGELLPFPALLIASRDDPYSSFEESAALAVRLGAKLVDAGFSGHINSESGHGPWPEGLLRFAAFLKALP